MAIVPDSCRLYRSTRNHIGVLEQEPSSSSGRHVEEETTVPDTNITSGEATVLLGSAQRSHGPIAVTGRGTGEQRDSSAGGLGGVSQRTRTENSLCGSHQWTSSPSKGCWSDGVFIDGSPTSVGLEPNTHAGAELHRSEDEGPGASVGQSARANVHLYVNKSCTAQAGVRCDALGTIDSHAGPLHVSQLQVDPVRPETILMDSMRGAAREVSQYAVRLVLLPAPQWRGLASALQGLASWHCKDKY